MTLADPPVQPTYDDERLRWQAHLVDAVNQAVVATDLLGQIRYLNAAAQRLCGWPEHELTGRVFSELLIEPSRHAEWASALERVVAGQSWQGASAVRCRDGRSLAVDVTASPVRASDGAVEGMVALLIDVGERQWEEALRFAEQRHRARFEQGGIAQALTALDGRLVSVNPAAARLLERAVEDLLGRTIVELTHPDDTDEASERMAGLASGAPDQIHTELRLTRGSGSAVPVLLSMSVIRDSAERPTAYAAFIQDLSDVKRAQDELARLALHDALTGLPNRALLLDRIERAMLRQQRAPSSLALFLIDIDDFSTLNDSLGHAAGDELLRVLAARLQAETRPADTVARFGGDRLAVLCEGLDDPVQTIAQHLLAAIQALVALPSGEQVFLSASCGVALWPVPTAGALVAGAEAALARAKHRGRGRVVVFEEGLRQLAADRLRVVTELRHAVAREELRLYYQPVLELGQGHVVGFEALLRWQHPVRGLIGAGEFVPLAEETGLIVEIGEWVLRTACRTAASLADGGWPLRVSANLSARQLSQGDVVELLAAALAQTGVDPASLTLEVTESAVMEDADAALAVLGALKRLGVELSIDDFGTGYSSLVYLKHFPVDEIKVDAAFIAGLGSDADDSAIVASVVSLAKAVGVRVVAEGVETAEQLAVLRSLGCDLAQGFLWSQAVPSEELLTILRTLTTLPPFDAEPVVVAARPRAPRSDPTQERLLALHREGASLHTIAAALNTEGRRTQRGTLWRAASVARVIAEHEYPAMTLPSAPSKSLS